MPSSAGLHSLAADRRPPWRVVLVLAWPVLVQQFLVLSVGLYDQFLAGNNSPDDRAKHISYQAAQTTANYIAWSIYSLSALVAVGGTALVARFVGAGDRASAVRTTNQCVLLAIFFGAAFTPIILAVLPWGSRLLNPDPEAAESAVRFLQPIVWGMTCQFVAQAGIACLNGAGDTKTGPVVLSAVALLNIPLAWACFHGLGPLPELGFFGIGLGTALSHGVGCAMVLAVLARGRYGLKLELSRFRPDVSLIGRLLRISVPASVDSFSMCACQLWFLSLVTALGDVAAAAHGTAIRVEGLGYMTGQAFMIAASALVGQNLGARRPHEAAHAAWVALGLGCLGMSLMGVFFFAFAPELFHLFSPHEHQQPIVEAGVPVLRLVAFAMPPLSAIIVLTGALRGAGDTRFPILLTWIGFLVIRLPLAYLLTRAVVDLGPLGQVRGWDLGLMGAWYAMFADLAIRGVLFLGRFVGGKWKTVKV
ncbi:MAG TPA: MATE family efflux transporter [Gemmataceae bacterium]|jgi:putative MATE family efflux protein|nr:MATE family efflux transporter [Gemmataceae bacterium]